MLCVPDECVEGCYYTILFIPLYILKLVTLSFQRTNSHTTSERNAKGGERCSRSVCRLMENCNVTKVNKVYKVDWKKKLWVSVDEYYM